MEQFSKIFEKFVVEKSFLYLVSTPIGNLGDLSLRSIKTLQEVDYILCEDSRVTNKILSKLEIKNKNLISYNDFNSKNKRPVIIDNLVNKKCNYALVSDAGTPLISHTRFGAEFQWSKTFDCVNFLNNTAKKLRKVGRERRGVKFMEIH